MSKEGQTHGQHYCKHACGNRKFNKRQANKRRRKQGLKPDADYHTSADDQMVTSFTYLDPQTEDE